MAPDPAEELARRLQKPCWLSTLLVKPETVLGWHQEPQISSRHSSLIEGRPRRGRRAKVAHFLRTNWLGANSVFQ
jgi:hypothetical protein